MSNINENETLLDGCQVTVSTETSAKPAPTLIFRILTGMKAFFSILHLLIMYFKFLCALFIFAVKFDGCSIGDEVWSGFLEVLGSTIFALYCLSMSY